MWAARRTGYNWQRLQETGSYLSLALYFRLDHIQFGNWRDIPTCYMKLEGGESSSNAGAFFSMSRIFIVGKYYPILILRTGNGICTLFSVAIFMKLFLKLLACNCATGETQLVTQFCPITWGLFGSLAINPRINCSQVSNWSIDLSCSVERNWSAGDIANLWISWYLTFQIELVRAKCMRPVEQLRKATVFFGKFSLFFDPLYWTTNVCNPRTSLSLIIRWGLLPSSA